MNTGQEYLPVKVGNAYFPLPPKAFKGKLVKKIVLLIPKGHEL